ncbi:uncharacterized protein H6S33_007273 [Morchella sextelata]|uniref:uncharacterized protein n=1 Tax=Morchella sextelata TaxID=1174677 RepID=UPI001D03E03B|nr:uncharacterized protein H6S33_007273 [Morchella sextelata]KAH0603614.1 hypothetical protein H6S33_007273 [Morchella sextelata]
MTSAFSQTLDSITKTKLRVLKKQNTAFIEQKEQILQSAQAASDQQEKVEILLDGIKSWSTQTKLGRDPPAYISNIEQLLLQAKYDPTLANSCLQEWEAKIIKDFEFEEVRLQYAELFGKLLMEWVESAGSAGSPATQAATSPDSESFEKIGRKEMYEQRAIFESKVFTENKVDEKAILSYLQELFTSTKENKAKLEAIREAVKESGDVIGSSKISQEDLKLTIEALLTSDLMSNEKKDTLREFKRDEVILGEVTDVLNMHLASVFSWTWEGDNTAGFGIPVEMRRQLNQKYRVFQDEEIMQALMLEYIGMQWCGCFRDLFKSMFSSPAWKPCVGKLSKEHIERRKYFLQENIEEFSPKNNPETIEGHRYQSQRDSFFMAQLGTGGTIVNYDSESSGGDTDGEYLKSALETKQSLLHILSTECLLSTAIHGSFTVVRSDFSWFGPGLSHASILTVMSFFGVSSEWIKFFKTFLETPLLFAADGGSSSVRVRKCGVPISHSLSTVLGEAVLFCMDYAVNQRANGMFLYRIHDDFWLWNSNPDNCAAAWKEIQTFSSLVGLSFNDEKTGSVTVGASAEKHPELPEGDVKWGFLKFESSGRFVIDQAQVDVHIAELRLQLSAHTSIFGWIQAYNKYVAAFFINNFGTAAECFGREHVDMILSTLERIHREIFPTGSMIDYLAEQIQQRFGVQDIPAGWFYWPIALGGLEVKNPFVNQQAIRNEICEDPSEIFAEAIEKDLEMYDNLKQKWDEGRVRRDDANYPHLKDEPFMSFEEYVMFREGGFKHWQEAYEELLKIAVRCEAKRTPEMKMGILCLSDAVRSAPHSIGGDDGIDEYWEWILASFGDGVAKKWGGLEIVRPGALPVGMMDAWKKRVLHWEQ